MRILTFDIEDWFHILDYGRTETTSEWAQFPSRIEASADRILRLLEDSDSRATFFCLGWIAARFPQVIRRISELGYEIGSHSYSHTLAYNQTPQEFRNDLQRSLGVLGDLTGQHVNTYRIPGFSLRRSNLWVVEILLEEGIEVDCSIFPARRAHGGFPQFPTGLPTRITHDRGILRELPINVVGPWGMKFVFSGGGYFRLLPYTLLRKLFVGSDYVMTYFHPRDFDSDQPRMRGLSIIRRFKSYYGLSTAEANLRSLLKEMTFVDVAQATAAIDWENTPIFKV